MATTAERIVGYGCVEHRIKTIALVNPPTGVPPFVVVAPSARHVWDQLLAKLRECLIDLGARRAWVVEYAADAGFLSYLEEMGFARLKTFKLDDGIPVVELNIDAPFLSPVRLI